VIGSRLRGQVMTHAGEIGFIASALVLAAFGMKDMINLRIVAICSNFAFIAYALLLHLLPILVLHVVLLPLNGWRLSQALHQSNNVGATMLVKLLSIARTTVT
jgi:CRP/FNR family transcriptional regulator, cyclic AMP receptor protein